MSWIKENYHVAALGGGLLVLAGLGYTSHAARAAVQDGFSSSAGGRGTTVTVEGEDDVDKLDKSLTEVEKLEAKKTQLDRPVNFFTSVDLFTQNGDPDDLVDLLTMKDKVHPPIPNKWWVDHMIDPSMSNAPDLDEDGDGFSNGEEYAVKTDPNNPQDYGDLLTKLRVSEVKSDMWLLEFNSVLGDGFQFNLKYRAHGAPRVQTNRMGAADAISPGELFFKDGVGAQRFKLEKIEKRQMETSTGMTDVDFAIIEDQLENKKGELYELQFGMKQAQLNRTIKFDHTVVFYLDAIGESGNKFEVKENRTFALPSSGADKIYKLIDVELDAKNKAVAVSVERTVDGKTDSIKIPVK